MATLVIKLTPGTFFWRGGGKNSWYIYFMSCLLLTNIKASVIICLVVSDFQGNSSGLQQRLVAFDMKRSGLSLRFQVAWYQSINQSTHLFCNANHTLKNVISYHLETWKWISQKLIFWWHGMEACCCSWYNIRLFMVLGGNLCHSTSAQSFW